MFNYVIMAGSGALSYLLAQKGTEKKNQMWVASLAEYLLYVMLDMVAVYFCMTPLGRVTRVDNKTTGITQIQYGNTAILFALVIAVIVGIAAMVVKKKIDISAEVESR